MIMFGFGFIRIIYYGPEMNQLTRTQTPLWQVCHSFLYLHKLIQLLSYSEVVELDVLASFNKKLGVCNQGNKQQQQQQQQLSHLSQVFGVGYMNQKRITPDRVHVSAFSTHSYRAICLHWDL